MGQLGIVGFFCLFLFGLGIETFEYNTYKGGDSYSWYRLILS